MAWAPDYASLADLKSYLRIDDTVDDTELALALTAASRAVDQETGRQFGVVGSPEERKYPGYWDRHRGCWFIEIDDLMTTTGLTIEDSDGTAVTAAQYTMLPLNASQKSLPWTEIETSVSVTETMTVTANWGWTAVPGTIDQATLIQASRFYQRRESPFGVAGSPELGNELRLLNKVDPDVSVMLRPFKRWWGAVS